MLTVKPRALSPATTSPTPGNTSIGGQPKSMTSAPPARKYSAAARMSVKGIWYASTTSASIFTSYSP